MVRKLIYSLIFPFCFIYCYVLGYNIINYGTYSYGLKIINPYTILAFVLLSLCCFILYSKLDKIENSIFNIKVFPIIDKLFFQNNSKSFWFCFLLISICHLPAFLAYFPGIFTYDTMYQIEFFVNNDYREIHPLLHNFIIYGVFLFSKIFKTSWGGVFLHTIFQSFIMISIYSYCIIFLSKYNTTKIIRLFALLFFAFYPTNQVFSLIATKDVLFSGAVLLMIMLLYRYNDELKNSINSKNTSIALILTITFVMLIRYNGLLAYIICVPFLLYYFRKYIKHSFIVFIVPLVFISLFYLIKLSVGIEPPYISSMLSVPLQQMGRVRIYQSNELSSNDINTYKTLVSAKNEYNYDAFCVDYLKMDDLESSKCDYLENSLKENYKQIIPLYFKWAKKYPTVYIDAFLMLNLKYWSVNAIYERYELYYYLYTDNRWDNYFGVPIRMQSLLPKLKNYYDKIFIENYFNKSPLTYFLFSIAWNTWTVFFLMLILFFQKRYNCIISLIMIPAIFITLNFGAIALLRYIYIDFLIIPLLIAFTFGGMNKEKF